MIDITKLDQLAPDDWASWGFESPIQAVWRRRDLQSLLINHEERVEQSDALSDLGAELQECADRRPRWQRSCSSAACPVCMRAVRIWWTQQARLILDDQPCFFVTLIHPGIRIAPGSLGDHSLSNITRRFAEILRNADIGGPAIGGIDLSLNRLRGRPPDHWCPHLHTIVQTTLNQRQLRRRLRKFFESDDRTPRPVRCRRVKNFDRAASYTLKSVFEGREEYLSPGGERQTQPFNLRVSERLELLEWLSSQKVSDRFVLSGVRQHGNQLLPIRPACVSPKLEKT